MYAVIFTATIRTLDDEYTKTAEKLRALAFEKYRCIHFTSCTEGSHEIALSYWHSEADILAWHADPQHKAAQIRGKQRWYESYKAEITKVLR